MGTSQSPLSNWLPSSTSLQSVAQMNFINPIRNLFRGSEAEIQAMSSTYDALCSNRDDIHPTGSCVNLATCMFSGGTAAPATANDNCGPLEGVCCTHHLSCGDTMVSRVAFWESEKYPALSPRADGCTINITPNRNVCYIRAEFIDLVLTAPRVDICEGNTLTISGQAEGNSGVLCGNLNQHETLIKVREGMTGVFRVYQDVVMHMDVQDKLHKYLIKLTQIKCDQSMISPIKISRRHSRTSPRGRLFTSTNETSESVKEEDVKTELPPSKDEPSTTEEPQSNPVEDERKNPEEKIPIRVRRQTYRREKEAKITSSDSQSRNDFFPDQVPNPQDTLQLQNTQTLGQWTWLRNMVSSLPSFGNILDSSEPAAVVQPLKSDVQKSACDPRVSRCETRSSTASSDSLGALLTRPSSSSLSMKSPQNTNSQLLNDQEIIRQLFGDKFNPDADSELRPTNPKLRRNSNSLPAPKLEHQTNPHVRPQDNRQFEALATRLPAGLPDRSIKNQANSENKINKMVEIFDKNQSILAFLGQSPTDMNGSSSHFKNDTVTITTEPSYSPTLGNITGPTPTNKSDLQTLSGESTSTADSISVAELKEVVEEGIEARKASGDGLSLPRRRSSYGQTSSSLIDDGFVVLVSPLDAPNANKEPQASGSDLNALAQHVGKLAATNFLNNLRQSQGVHNTADHVTSQGPSPSTTQSSPKEKDTSFYGYLIVRNEVGEHFFCSATLISPRFALTAASCVMRKGFETKNYRIHAVFNQDDLGDPRFRSGETLFNKTHHVRVSKTVFHPMYKHGELAFDLAVLKLERDMIKCTPVSIARPDTELVGEDITMLGHGVRPTPLLNFAAYERHLTYINGRYLHQEACNEIYDDSPMKRKLYHDKFILPEMLCILTPKGIQLCEGDQGGPVVINFEDEEKPPRLIGIASGNDNNCVGVKRWAFG
ncbi:uncharacterized protein LOC108677503 [Hyalella azteca]|uniref:Uncharacterized protein LOC108677503 n=1 Tax=Hyalella azteca TaxID=294128 RepID=A0A8B7P503_HYAAZ|nr:uncharacterized protein LOC108677503 [Hyalella azteca]